jgi:hypothetical protein
VRWTAIQEQATTFEHARLSPGVGMPSSLKLAGTKVIRMQVNHPLLLHEPPPSLPRAEATLPLLPALVSSYRCTRLTTNPDPLPDRVTDVHTAGWPVYHTSKMR